MDETISHEDRLADARAQTARAKERTRNPIIDPRQKFPAGEDVYIRPIYEPHMIHFTADCMAIVEGTYGQLYGGSSAKDFQEYSTSIAAWYKEKQLMPSNGRSIEECRAACKEYFGISYEKFLDRRNKSNQRNAEFWQNCFSRGK